MFKRQIVGLSLCLTLLTSPASWAIGIITSHDPEIVGASTATYYYLRSGRRMTNERIQLAEYIDKLDAEIESLNGKADSVSVEAKEIKEGKFSTKEMKRVYTGKYADPNVYSNNPNHAALIVDNTYRLQADGIDAIIDTMKNHPEMANNSNISLRIHQIEEVTESLGAKTGVDVRVAARTITGNISELETQLKNLLKINEAKQIPGSIIKVDLAWKVRATPNPTLAAKTELRANKLKAKAEALNSAKEGKIASQRALTNERINKLKNIRKGGIAVIIAMVGASLVTEAIAEELVAIDQSCSDPYFLQIKAKGLELANESSDFTADDYAFKLDEACAKLSEVGE